MKLRQSLHASVALGQPGRRLCGSFVPGVRRRVGKGFIPNANGVGANAGEPLIARTPLALRLNVWHQATLKIAPL